MNLILQVISNIRNSMIVFYDSNVKRASNKTAKDKVPLHLLWVYSALTQISRALGFVFLLLGTWILVAVLWWNSLLSMCSARCDYIWRTICSPWSINLSTKLWFCHFSAFTFVHFICRCVKPGIFHLCLFVSYHAFPSWYIMALFGKSGLPKR